ncbi:unnamed protein product [Wuchereria bancrofti]|nr:unnamed protein product [Wuchereria bancrofti]
MNSSKYKNSKSLEVLLSNLSLSASLHMTNLTTLGTDKVISADKSPITKAIPQTTSTDATSINGIFITEIPLINEKHKIVSVTDTMSHTKVTSKTIPINMIDTTITISTDNDSTFYGTNSMIISIFNSHLQSALFDNKKSSNEKLVTNSLLKPIISLPTTNGMIISSSQNVNIAGAQIGETNFTKSYLHTERKIYQQQQRKEDELKVKPDYNRMKANSTISPIITYSQSAPKTRLDQWKWEMKQQQQQQSVNQEWINNKNNNNGDSDNHNNHNIFNNSHRILSSSSSSSSSLSPSPLSSSIFSILLFSLFSFRSLLSL